MAKKKNIYSEAQKEVLRTELFGVIEYLESIDLYNITDRVDWKATATGKMMPTVISSIEKIITTCVKVISQSVNMIITLYEQEGMDDTLKTQIEITVNKLNELQNYFFQQRLASISDRKLEIPIGTNKKGETKVMRIVVASSDDQIQARGRITESILKILPLIQQIESYTKLTARGGVEVGTAMERFLKRNGKT